MLSSEAKQDRLRRIAALHCTGLAKQTHLWVYFDQIGSNPPGVYCGGCGTPRPAMFADDAPSEDWEASEIADATE